MADMRIGGLTACGPRMTLEDWMKEGKRMGLDGLEVATFPASKLGDVASGERKDYVSDTINVDEPLQDAKAREIIQMSNDFGVAIHALGSYDNHLHPTEGKAMRSHFKNVIDAASKLREVMPAGPLVATFVGANPEVRIQDNYELFKQHFIPMLAYAKSQGVRVMIENCPMEGWEKSDRPVNNLMSSPRLWNACFKAASDAGVLDAFGLEYDPSHRIWQTAGRMDLVEKDVENYTANGRIFAIHGKGAKFKDEGLYMDGIDGQLVDLGGNEWAKRGSVYDHAVPGVSYDSVQWGKVLSHAKAAGVPFVTIEIEDPAFKDMTDPVRNGQLGVKAIELGRKNLIALCYENGTSYQPVKR